MKMFHDYKLTYLISIFDDEVSAITEKTLHFWGSQGFLCENAENKVVGRRGSVEGNKNAFDIWKVSSELIVEYEGDLVKCTISYNGMYQWFTDWDITCAQLELIMFRGYLLNKPESKFIGQFREELSAAGNASKKTLGIIRKKMPVEWKKKLVIEAGENGIPFVHEIGKSKLNGKEFSLAPKLKWKDFILPITIGLLGGFIKNVYFPDLW